MAGLSLRSRMERWSAMPTAKEYSYLFWEGVSNAEYDLSKGWCVPGDETAEFLQETLAALGLTPKNTTK